PAVDAGVLRGFRFDRDREAAPDQELGDRAELFADAAGGEFADERSVPEAGRHSRDYTTATPFSAGGKWPATLLRHHAGRARQDPAEDPCRALHRRRATRGLAHALPRQRPRAFARD